MLWQAYACGYDLSRDNALMSGVRQKERFSPEAPCPSEIGSFLNLCFAISPQLNSPEEFNGARGVNIANSKKKPTLHLSEGARFFYNLISHAFSSLTFNECWGE